jgi:peptidoglycan lytic transglycosylase G
LFRRLPTVFDGPGAGMELKRITPRSPRAALEPEHVPMPARPSRRVRHPLVIAGNAVVTLLLMAAIVIGGGFALAKQRFEAPGPLAQDKIVNIPRAYGVRDIADLLQREGVIDQPMVFVGAALVLKTRGEELKFGEYQFARAASLREIVDTIIEGKVVQHLLTIPEGLTSEQIVQRLLEVEALSGNIKEIPREGTLLPEGYRFTRGMARELLIQRMQEAQRRVLREIWDRRMQDLPVRTPEQLVVLASIIEKETGRPEERTRVASVFVNRLKQRMKLQSDPTIIYGLVGGRATLGRPIARSDIEQPTPYNTYVIEGLPPGPIANPGRASLEAAANPARTKELFFVADGTGGHAFAENYDAHQRNVARLRVIEKDQKDTAPAELQTLPTPSTAPGRPAQPAQQQRQPRQGAAQGTAQGTASPRASAPQGRQQ